MSFVKSMLSYLWPVKVWSGHGKYGPLDVVWEQGQLVVNSNDANLSYGNLHAIWQECLDDQRVKERSIGSILLLGFGAGSSASILRHELRMKAPITGVDGDPEMLRLARTFFKVEQFSDLALVQADALEFVKDHQARYDLVLVDLCHGLDLAPGVDTQPFIEGLWKCVAAGGLLCFNTIVYDETSRARSQRVSTLLRQYFGRYKEHLYQGVNRVLTAVGTNEVPQTDPTGKEV